MAKLEKKRNLNPTIREMEQREAVAERKAREGCLTEKVRKELNQPHDPGVSATIRKLKKRKQIA